MIQRIIVHVDMDAFFTSIEQLDNPAYRDKPVIVGSDPREGRGRGVVSAASYEARRFGIHSAMPISLAYKKCPHALFLRPRFDRYAELSNAIVEIFGSFSPLVEPISIDEAFLDCTGTESLFGDPHSLGSLIKTRIFEKTGLRASVGIASGKSVAKIASDLHKPDSLTICAGGNERDFLAPLPVGRLWGAGKKTVIALQSAGFFTIGDIACFPHDEFVRMYGKQGSHLWKLANGIDDRPVENADSIKSLSEEHTFEVDTDDLAAIYDIMLGLADRLSRRMRSRRVCARTLTIKIRFAGFETFTRSLTPDQHFNDMFTLRDRACELFDRFDCRGKPVRLIGIGVSNLLDENDEESRQLDLFADTPIRDRRQTLERLLDDLKADFGDRVARASLLRSSRAQ